MFSHSYFFSSHDVIQHFLSNWQIVFTDCVIIYHTISFHALAWQGEDTRLRIIILKNDTDTEKLKIAQKCVIFVHP